MRKLLGLLVAAVFVTSVVAMAQAVTIDTTTMKSKMTAIVTFDVNGTFGFALKRAAVGALPKAADTPATQVDWLVSEGGALQAGIAPGAVGLKNSLVYAEITNNLAPGYKVLFYTDNNGAGSGTKYGAGASTTALPLVELPSASATQGTDNDGLPLAYIIASSKTVWTSTEPKDMTEVGGAPVTKIEDIFFMNVAGPTPIEGLRTSWVMDKFNGGYTDPSATIALVNNVQNGNKVMAKPAATGPNAADIYWYEPQAEGEAVYMFFSTAFASARRGFTYKTTELTIEMQAGE